MDNLIQYTTAVGATIVRLTSADGTETIEVSPDKALEAMGEMMAKGQGLPSCTYFGPDNANITPQTEAPKVSGFGTGNQVHDSAAETRIRSDYATLEASGVTGLMHDKTTVGYKVGTRMAQIGYDNQARRKREFLEMRPASEALGELEATIKAEGREILSCSGKELAQNLTANGKIRAFGFALSEQAIRGLLTSRLKSPALSYILGLREAIVVEHAKGEDRNQAMIHAHTAEIAGRLAYACDQAPDARIALRTRKNPHDVFACVSDEYSEADFPRIAPEILRDLPKDARGSYSYDPTSTKWDFRSDVWTATDVAKQAVGEAFQGFGQIGGCDNGTGRLGGSGGIVILACLNAGTYMANEKKSTRVHRGMRDTDIAGMIQLAMGSIDALCQAWGMARHSTVEIPDPLVGKPIGQVLPGFWRALLTDTRELAGVLPGQTEKHVERLAVVQETERRNKGTIVRADFGQAFTRYIQDFPMPVQRTAEAEIGAWMVKGSSIGWVPSKKEEKASARRG